MKNQKYLLLILALAVFVIPFVSAATNLTGCQYINVSGEYVLINDIADDGNTTCFFIEANDVSIDCQGYMIDGNDTDGSLGIYACGQYSCANAIINTTIKNCVISDWGKGVLFDGGGFSGNNKEHTLFNSTLKSNGYGLDNNHRSLNISSNYFLDNSVIGLHFYCTINNCGGFIYNNFFNNTDNAAITSTRYTSWNITNTTATNIIGGSYIGGNFYANPNGTGFSETSALCNPMSDGFCKNAYVIDVNNADYLSLTNLTPDTEAPNVTLNYPTDGYTSKEFSTTFNCSATDNVNLKNITLYGDFSGNWTAMSSANVSGTSGSSLFVVSDLADGTYNWNCLVYDSSDPFAFASSNYTLIVKTSRIGTTDTIRAFTTFAIFLPILFIIILSGYLVFLITKNGDLSSLDLKGIVGMLIVSAIMAAFGIVLIWKIGITG
jgi:hypothetical protein